jgi:hypothetical protein
VKKQPAKKKIPTKIRSKTESVYVGGLPPTLKRKFKAHCDRSGLTMAEVLEAYMRATVAPPRKEETDQAEEAPEPPLPDWAKDELGKRQWSSTDQ